MKKPIEPDCMALVMFTTEPPNNGKLVKVIERELTMPDGTNVWRIDTPVLSPEHDITHFITEPCLIRVDDGKDFWQHMEENLVDLEPEFAKAIDEHFMELIE